MRGQGLGEGGVPLAVSSNEREAVRAAVRGRQQVDARAVVKPDLALDDEALVTCMHAHAQHGAHPLSRGEGIDEGAVNRGEG